MALFFKLLSSLILIMISPSCQQVEFTYTGFKPTNTNISLNGVAFIHNNGVLQLTNETARLIGHAFYPTPLRFKNSTNGTVFSFSTCFAICIHPEYPKLGGHGLAFAISRTKELKSARPSQYLGLFNTSEIGNFSDHLFAVEFDTVQDFEFGDINDNHVGIDINTMASNSSASAAYFKDDMSKTDLNLKGGKPILVWVDYDSVTNFINVTISPSSSKPRTPLLSFQMDLSPILQQSMYVGFSASTGLLASSHYILGWSFKMNGEAHSLNLGALPLVPGIKRVHKRVIVSFSVLAFLFFLGLIFVAIYSVRRIKNAETIESWELEVGPCRYKYVELKQATKNFKESELLGFGGFGRVYKGKLPSTKMNVAVKRISHESKQGIREFVSEISTIGRLRHRNLVQLLGWCRRGVDLLLVYDFMPNGSLEKFLFDEPECFLSWEQRFRIVKGVAAGLLYLHEGYEKVVIHRDVKASNVLLDAEMNGKLGDFGLAKLYDHGSKPSTTRVVGTFGYIAPELPKTGRSTTSSDVFAFGTLLLEVVCGRRPVESKAGPDDLVLVDHVWSKCREGRLLDVVDEKLKGNLVEHEVLLVLKLGLLCLSYEQASRPSMRQVLSYLEGEVEMTASLKPLGPGAHDQEGGFENYMHSYASSAFDHQSSSSYVESGNGNREDGSSPFLTTLPQSLMHGLGEPR